MDGCMHGWMYDTTTRGDTFKQINSVFGFHMLLKVKIILSV